MFIQFCNIQGVTSPWEDRLLSIIDYVVSVRCEPYTPSLPWWNFLMMDDAKTNRASGSTHLSWVAVVSVGLACSTLAPPESSTPSRVPSPFPEARGEQGRRPPGSSTAVGGPRLQIVNQADTGSQPKSVSVSPDGTRVFVCNFGYRDHDNLWVFDAQTLDHVGTISFQGNAVETAFSPDGQTLYISNFRGAKLMVVDVATLQIRAEVDVGLDPKTIALSPDGSIIYVANYAGNSVSVVDATRLVETRRIRAGIQPRGMAVASDGRLFVAAFRDHVTRIFDPEQDYSELREIGMCRFPRHLALSPDDSRLYVSCSSVRVVHWHLVVDGRRTGIVPVGHNPRTIDMSENGRYIAVADFDSSTVSLIDTVTLTHRINEVRGADRIVGVAIHPGSALRVYATSWNNSRLFALEPEGHPPPASNATTAQSERAPSAPDQDDAPRPSQDPTEGDQAAASSDAIP